MAMLLQLEVIIWITSVLLLIGVPIVGLWNSFIKKHEIDTTNEQISDTLDEENSESKEQDELISDEDEYQDPVIAAMREEELEYQKQSSDQQQESEELSEESHNLTQQDMVVESEVDQEDMNILLQGQQGGVSENIQIDNKEQDSDGDIVLGEGDGILKEIVEEIVMIDENNDGVIDEIIITQSSIIPSDLAEAKRQKSLDMIKFDLRTLKEKNQLSMYEKKLIEARSLHPEYDEFTVMLAEYYYESSEYKKALGLYRKLVDIHGSDDKSLAMVANCYIKLGERNEAQIILEKLVQDKSENPRYRMSLAEVYYHEKDIDATIECVKMMVKLRPTNSDYLSTLAQLYHESAYYDLYIQILYRMLELDPLNHEIKAEIEKYS